MLPFILLTLKKFLTFIYFLRHGLTVYSWLTWNLLWKPLWPQIQRPTCLLIAEIKGIQPHAWQICLILFLDFVLCFCDTTYSTYICFYIKYTFIFFKFTYFDILIKSYKISYICLICYFSNGCPIVKASILFFSLLTFYLDSSVLVCFVLSFPQEQCPM